MSSLQLKNPLRLDHLAIWVDDMNKAVAFCTDVMGWKRHPMVIEVSDDDPTVGGMEAVFIDANGLWLEFILPTSPGPGMDILEEKGAGTIVEINFEALNSDFQTILKSMNDKKIQMLNMDGSPLVNSGKIQEGVRGQDETTETGQYIAYWPKPLAGGSTVEVYERVESDATNLLNVRDAQWKDEQPDKNAPRLHHISIMVRDLEDTAKFYTDTLGLPRSPATFSIDSEENREIGGMNITFIHTNNRRVWLELVAPRGPGPIMDYLNMKGDGYFAELIAEVDDIETFYDQMKAKGIQLTNIDGTPLSDSKKYDVVEPYGEKIVYIPEDIACGMTIEVIERGPTNDSIMNRLYATPPV